MTTMRWVVCFSLFCAYFSFAQERREPFNSSYAERLLLFQGVRAVNSADSIPSSLLPSGSRNDRKSVGLAALYSLFVPGMGELYASGFSSGKYFLAAEGALWLTYATFQIHGDGLRDDAHAYSASRAGVNATGKDDQFYIDIGNFMNTADYNAKKLRDREPDKTYDPALGYAWQWESDAARVTFRDQRIASENAYNNRKFVGLAILVNHVASAINAARAAIAHNSELDNPLGDLQIGANVMGGPGNPHGIMLTLVKGL